MHHQFNVTLQMAWSQIRFISRIHLGKSPQKTLERWTPFPRNVLKVGEAFVCHGKLLPKPVRCKKRVFSDVLCLSLNEQTFWSECINYRIYQLHSLLLTSLQYLAVFVTTKPWQVASTSFSSKDPGIPWPSEVDWEWSFLKINLQRTQI